MTERAPLFPGSQGTLLCPTHWVWSLRHFKGRGKLCQEDKGLRVVPALCSVACILTVYCPSPHIPTCRRSPPPGCSGPGHSLQQRTETRLSLKIEDVGKEVAGSFPCWVGTVPTPPGRTLPSFLLLDPAGEDSRVSRQFFTAFEH